MCDRTGQRSPKRAILARAEQLLEDFGGSRVLQSPTALAHAQRIVEIARLDISFDACLLPVPNGFRVELCRFHSSGRQNFSIAHEIGHTFLIELNPALGLPKREAGLDRGNQCSLVEQLCDTAAAELLWPTARFQRDAWELGPSLRSVLELAKRYKASVTATARRFAELCCWRCYFVVWESVTNRRNETIHLQPRAMYRSPFVSPIYKQDLIATENSQFYSALRTKEILRGREPITADKRKCYIESVRLGNGEGAQVLSLLLVEPYAEYVARPRRSKPQLSLFLR